MGLRVCLKLLWLLLGKLLLPAAETAALLTASDPVQHQLHQVKELGGVTVF